MSILGLDLSVCAGLDLAMATGVQEVPVVDSEGKEQKVTPWEAHAAEGETTIDYDKLIS